MLFELSLLIAYSNKTTITLILLKVRMKTFRKEFLDEIVHTFNKAVRLRKSLIHKQFY